MPLKTLDQFLEGRCDDRLMGGANAYVKEPGFASLYVRINRRSLNGRIYNKVFDIASVEVKARQRGKGIFTKLVERLLARGLIVYVESVMNDRLAAWLERNGFTRIDRYDRSYFRFPCAEDKNGE